jgi:hypothetical protein
VLLSRVREVEELEELVCWRRLGEGWVVRAREERRGDMVDWRQIAEMHECRNLKKDQGDSKRFGDLERE